MGLEAMFAGRQDSRERSWNRLNKGMEFMWPVSEDESIFTHIFMDHYASVNFLEFNGYSHRAKPIVIDRESAVYNGNVV